MKCLVFLILLATQATATKVPCEEYRRDFEAGIRYYWRDQPIMEWEWLAAQVYAESSCNPHAQSPAGAEGIAQFLPSTFDEVLPKIMRDVPQLRKGNVYDPHTSILAQAAYMRQQFDYCGKRIGSDPKQTQLISTAAYNAGAGNICIKLFRISGAKTWPEMSTQLHRVTGKHSKETNGYVKKIERTYKATQNRTDKVRHVFAGYTPASIPTPLSEQKPIRELTETEAEEKAKEILVESAASVLPGGTYLWHSIILNYQFAFGPAILAILLLGIACYVFDKLDPSYDTAEELKLNNLSVALWRCTFALVIGAVLCVSIYTGMR